MKNFLQSDALDAKNANGTVTPSAHRSSSQCEPHRLSEPIKLLDLPGIADVEAICALPNLWDPKRDGLDELADRVSLSLFGITEDDTIISCSESVARSGGPEWEAYQAAWEEREAHFGFLDDEDDADPAIAQMIWQTAGWGINGLDGQPLRCLPYFERQIICVIKKLVPNAVLSITGKAELSDRQAQQAAEAWGAALARDAEKFKRSA